jgi:hypothetical protein
MAQQCSLQSGGSFPLEIIAILHDYDALLKYIWAGQPVQNSNPRWCSIHGLASTLEVSEVVGLGNISRLTAC